MIQIAHLILRNFVGIRDGCIGKGFFFSNWSLHLQIRIGENDTET